MLQSRKERFGKRALFKLCSIYALFQLSANAGIDTLFADIGQKCRAAAIAIFLAPPDGFAATGTRPNGGTLRLKYVLPCPADAGTGFRQTSGLCLDTGHELALALRAGRRSLTPFHSMAGGGISSDRFCRECLGSFCMPLPARRRSGKMAASMPWLRFFVYANCFNGFLISSWALEKMLQGGYDSPTTLIGESQ